LKEVGDDLQKHGSKEKTGFMEKDAEFVKNLKSVQTYHLDTCTLLLKIGIFAMFAQFVYACFCMFYFGCGVGDCENGLVCYVHYIKFCQAIFLINTYQGNIKEKQPNHPIGQINTFIVILLYYGCLLIYINDPHSHIVEDKNMVHWIVAYPGADFILILISFYMISKVKQRS